MTDVARKMRLRLGRDTFVATDVRMRYETRIHPGDEDRGLAPFVYQTGRAFVDVSVDEPTFAMLEMCSRPSADLVATVEARTIDDRGRVREYAWRSLEPVGFTAPVPSEAAVLHFLMPEGGFTVPEERHAWN